MDVFRGQMTNEVIFLLKENNIILIRVPANMTYISTLRPNCQSVGKKNVIKKIQEVTDDENIYILSIRENNIPQNLNFSLGATAKSAKFFDRENFCREIFSPLSYLVQEN